MTQKNRRLAALLLATIAPSIGIADSPVPITVVNAKDIELQGFTSAADVIDSMPHIDAGTTSNTSGQSVINLRGLGADRTLVLVNGRRSTPASGIVNSSGVEIDGMLIPNNYVKRIEVLRGNDASLYGSDAVAGVVNIITRDDFQGFDTRGSYLLNDTFSGLNDFSLALQSKEDCDATHGTESPPWAFFDRYDWGMPEFTLDGGTAYFGSESKGFAPNRGYIPNTGGATTTAGGNGVGGGNITINDIYASAGKTFHQADALIDRVHNDPTISEAHRDYFIMGIGMAGMFGGEDSFSDQAFDAGLFDPEKWFQDLKEFIAKNPVPPPLLESDDPLLGGSRTAAPTTPGVASSGSTSRGTMGGTSTPSEPATPAKDIPNPFERYPYPPDYAFEFEHCTERQAKELNDLIFLRDKARASHSYFSDYLRRDGQTLEDIADDQKNAEAAIAARDRYNDELRIKWKNCISPKTTNASSVTQPSSGTSKSDATVSDGTKAESASQTTTSSSAGENNRPWDEPMDWTRSLADRLTTRFPIRLEIHIDEDVKGEGDRWNSQPMPGLGLNVFPYRPDALFGLPFTPDAVRNTERDSGTGFSGTFTDDNGVGRLTLPTGSLRSALLNSANRWAEDSRTETDRNTDNYSDDEVDDERLDNAVSPRIHPGAWNGSDSEGGSASSRYIFDRYGPKGASDPLDWQIGVRYNLDNYSIDAIGLKFKHKKEDSVVQTFGGSGKPGMSFGGLGSDVWDAIPSGLRVGNSFSFGGNLYVRYDYLENDKVDLRGLFTVPGSTGVSNNQCGDTAATLEQVGYTPSARSLVKSLDDQWAFENVGIAKGESLLGTNVKPIVVGIVDTGIDWNHLDFAWDNLWQNENEIPDNGIDDDNNGFVDDIIGWDFTADDNKPWDADGHGTFVSGIIAATHGNDAGIDGINPSAKIMILKALNTFGRTRATYVAQAIVYGVDNGANIINISVSGPGFPSVVQDAVDYANSKNVLVVLAAGNKGESIDNAKPARLQGVVTVAATGPGDNRAAFSNTGDSISVAAPGVDVISLRARRTDFLYNNAATSYVRGDAFIGEDNRYYRSTGTSFSAPIVSGVASLVWANRPELTANQVRLIIEQSARDIEAPGYDRLTGYGVVDAKSALAADPRFYVLAFIPAAERLDVDGQTFLQILGTAAADDMTQAIVEIGTGAEPLAWTQVGQPLDEAVYLSELARIPAQQLLGTQHWTVRLTVTHKSGKQREAYYSLDLGPQ